MTQNLVSNVSIPLVISEKNLRHFNWDRIMSNGRRQCHEVRFKKGFFFLKENREKAKKKDNWACTLHKCSYFTLHFFLKRIGEKAKKEKENNLDDLRSAFSIFSRNFFLLSGLVSPCLMILLHNDSSENKAEVLFNHGLSFCRTTLLRFA